MQLSVTSKEHEHNLPAGVARHVGCRRRFARYPRESAAERGNSSDTNDSERSPWFGVMFRDLRLGALERKLGSELMRVENDQTCRDNELREVRRCEDRQVPAWPREVRNPPEGLDVFPLLIQWSAGCPDSTAPRPLDHVQVGVYATRKV